VEQVLGLVFVGARVATLLQMIPALPQGVQVSPEPVEYAVLWGTAAVVTAAVAVASVVRRRGLPPAAVACDVALAVGFLVAGTESVPVPYRIGSWVGWAPGYALAVVISAAGMRRTFWFTAMGSVTVAYVYFFSGAATVANRSTLVGDSLTVVVLGGLARIGVRYIRRVARDADEARARVAELARREEEHRAQLTMHNATTIMQLLSDPELPAATRAQLREQAAAEVRRMRAYLRGGADPARAAGSAVEQPGRISLRAVLEEAMTGFADLGLEPALDLVDGVTIGAHVGEAIRGATASVLHNVRRHAGASMVIVHADAWPETGRWEVTVRDNGSGFDTATTPLGTGLGRQVLAELARHGLAASIDSTPGLGTRVTIEGNVAG